MRTCNCLHSYSQSHHGKTCKETHLGERKTEREREMRDERERQGGGGSAKKKSVTMIVAAVVSLGAAVLEIELAPLLLLGSLRTFVAEWTLFSLQPEKSHTASSDSLCSKLGVRLICGCAPNEGFIL